MDNDHQMEVIAKLSEHLERMQKCMLKLTELMAAQDKEIGNLYRSVFVLALVLVMVLTIGIVVALNK